ncbi:monovalent cation/H(+) antiporter subunit G [Methylobrevis pamukkalensis]|uniref:Na(+)/H(+) antiporter subunit G1 n=1 Tax=Methylobrevis pamukkalensis TaxID=1439726 RepID=A0A1E3GZ72_9HYPH|nr:monovalent cation/H(+) antiporter subunit G [Methylobrevis pamukkalensis]ODN68866.1 Na(+)/H(+) antiporter subunit G1 [Methylobrevis pamukkalensis]
MTGLLDILTGLLLLAGGVFAVAGALGLLRFPDVYTRMHAASKAGTLGSGFALVAVAVYAADLGVAIRAIAAVMFLMLTAPISAHLLARAALLAGYPPAPATRMEPDSPSGVDALH